jgi:P27 family predicted phage terminase small subunit
MGRPASSKPGPQPLPDNVHELRGRPAHHAPRPEIKVESIAPEVPDYLSRRAKAIWKQVAPELMKNALLSKRDQVAFATFCMNADIMIAAYEDLHPDKRKSMKLTDFDTSHDRYRRAHSLTTFNQASMQVLRYIAEFGLSPATRVGLLAGGDAGSGARGSQDDYEDQPDLFG